ncbi:MAG: DUF2442 domain-containing protein [Bythopirellula sp.]|nr:DUF2442 domain-containing protein [Bythopirellula sp.]
MPSLVSVRPLADYCVHLAYDDGVSGQVDLSHLTGKGVFSAWHDLTFFKQVTIGEFGELSWGSDIELCPDALYLQLTGKAAEQIFPGMSVNSHA